MAGTTPHASLTFLLAFAASMSVASGHGRMTVPQARNQNDNGAVAGGPGSVHAFVGEDHTKYKHGICGNAAGVAQTYNAVGDVQATYTAGTVAEIKVVITAHHVGYFELELCEDAGQLSESCFMQHRLLREGCSCSCPSDTTNSCPACDACRRWWKPLLDGERGQSVTSGYEGPSLPGQGNVVPYEFTMKYVIPAGIRTSRGVLRWHYMTTNSCTSKSSSPEEFWNCADVAVTDSNGASGGDVAFDNAALESMTVQDLMPMIEAGSLTGVYSTCPEDSAGALLGVGTAQDYQGLCGAFSSGSYELCVDMTAGEGASAECNEVTAGDITCETECGDWWLDCANGIAYLKQVPAGTKCRGGEFVLQAQCDNPTSPGVTPATTPMPTSSPEPSPSPAPSPTEGPPASGEDCRSCTGCLFDNGVCYDDATESYCSHWATNIWCGSNSLVQLKEVHRSSARSGKQRISELRKASRSPAFLGAAFIQAGMFMGQAGQMGEPSEEL